jgi:hypothetical protein
MHLHIRIFFVSRLNSLMYATTRSTSTTYEYLHSSFRIPHTKNLFLIPTVLRDWDIIRYYSMHYTRRYHLCRHNGSLFDIKWRIKFSCKINFTTISFISGERMRKGRL